MFGQHRKNRKHRREKKRKESERMFKAADKEGESLPTQEYNALRRESSGAAMQDQGHRDARRQQNMEQSKREVTQEMPGLTDQQRRALQEKASAQISRDMDNYSRQISSSAGARGMRGGAVSAQQRDLMRRGLEARQGFERDLTDKDIDLQMQRLGATLASTEGKVSQDLAEQQKAQDWLEARRQEKKNQAMGRFRQHDYNRV
jgi:hypothetical protein